ncbi:MAG: tRNA pseudouridine(55) synthase TruB [Alphaproteobacteria bacterium]
MVVDKPVDMGSMGITTRVRKALGASKAGHAGTLDPFATGLLPIALGKTTRLIPYLMQQLKVYRFCVAWGAQTTTGDLTGEIVEASDERPTRKEIEAVLSCFIGKIQQVPPAYAAIKIQGERAYVRARRQEVFEMPSREVLIQELVLLDGEGENHAFFEVTCGSGTYVRSLGQDIAKKLGTVGHLLSLRRTRVGPFCEKNGIPLDSILKVGHDRASVLYPSQAVLDDIPAFWVDVEQGKRLVYGQQLVNSLSASAGEVFKCLYKDQLIGLVRCEGSKVVPLNMFKEPQFFDDLVKKGDV